MSEQVLLEAEKRETEGKSSNRALRRSGSVPGIIYGGKEEPQRIAVLEKDISKAAEVSGFSTQILKISISGKKEDVVVKELQRHPSTEKLLHADFMRVNPDSSITLSVPIRFINEDTCVGVKQQGGVVSHLINDIEISCLASNLPEYIEIDLAELELGSTVFLSALKIPEGVEIIVLTKGDDKDQAVVSITEAKIIDIEPEIEEIEGEEGEELEEGEEAAEGKEGAPETTADVDQKAADSSEESQSPDNKKQKSKS